MPDTKVINIKNSGEKIEEIFFDRMTVTLRYKYEKNCAAVLLYWFSCKCIELQLLSIFAPVQKFNSVLFCAILCYFCAV